MRADLTLTPSQRRALEKVNDATPAQVSLRWLEKQGLRKAGLDLIERDMLSSRPLPSGDTLIWLNALGRAALDSQP